MSGQVLRQNTERVLEDAAFTFLDATTEPDPFRGEVIRAEISFRGPESGKIALAASMALGASLAANLLGEEPEEMMGDARCGDAVGEILNIVCGAVLEELFGYDAVSQIGSPEISVGEAANVVQFPADTIRVSFLTDEGHRLDAAVRFEEVH